MAEGGAKIRGPHGHPVVPSPIVKLIHPQLVTVGRLLGLSLTVKMDWPIVYSAVRDAMLRVPDCPQCGGSCNPDTHLWDPATLDESGDTNDPLSLANFIESSTPSHPIDTQGQDFISTLDDHPLLDPPIAPSPAPSIRPRFSSLNASPSTARFRATG
jgi:hypothetical protein